MLLSLAGAALGLVFARWGNDVLVHYLSTVRNKVFLDFSLDGRVLAFTAAIAIVTGLLFGVAPAFRGTHASLTTAIKEGALHPEGGADASAYGSSPRRWRFRWFCWSLPGSCCEASGNWPRWTSDLTATRFCW